MAVTTLVIPDLATRYWASTLSTAVGNVHRTHKALADHLRTYTEGLNSGRRTMTHHQRFTDAMEAEATLEALLTVCGGFIRTGKITEADVQTILTAGEEWVAIEGGE